MSQAFTILPMSQSLELKPGEVYTGSIKVTNSVNATEDFHYLVTAEPYGILGDEGQADPEMALEASKMVDWITIAEPQGILQPNETREVEFTITVPEDAAGGGQYAALMVAADPAAEASEGVSVKNSFAIGSILYANVEGDVVHDTAVLMNQVPGFVITPPVMASAVLENHGNVHESAVIKLNVTNKLSGQQIFSAEEANQSFVEIILPGVTRTVSRRVDDLPAVGVVNVEQTIYYGDEISTTQQDVVICPIWFILIVAVLIFSTVGLVVGLIMRRRRKRTHLMV